jgi:hypothetical protein
MGLRGDFGCGLLNDTGIITTIGTLRDGPNAFGIMT